MTPPDPQLLGNVALSFMGLALLAIIGIGWNTRELVRDLHATATNPRSGFDAIWAALDAMRDRLTTLERERPASPPDDADA